MLLSAATIAWAEPQADHPQLAAQVEGALEKCDWKVRTLTGGPKGLMLLHQAKMRRVLEALTAGRSVDPNKMAQIMKGIRLRDVLLGSVLPLRSALRLENHI